MPNRLKQAKEVLLSTLTKAEDALKSIGEKQAEINRIDREAKEEIEAVRKSADKKIAALKKTRNKFFNSLRMYATLRKKNLTATYRTVRTLAGSFGWRSTPHSVKIADGKTDAQIIAMLKARGLSEYVRVVEEVDRKALLKDKPILPDITYAQYDEFFARPILSKEDGASETLTKTEVIGI